ncbi:MAG: MBL fold metallo-hydrolase [Sulfobacillus acidophilus]|uniref:MBL fold metallo-hydrolase n=1 Tax=Sulfobacillus acidophilus TaxID=53633 RepID=A0A2T2WLB2_9FIRM|nr:MAG: MBL fold metallo-hydrolase [Sulfobacillus acidophilus]
MAVFAVTDNIFGIDLYEEGRPGRSCAYVIRAREPVLVETGSARSHPALVKGLEEVGVYPSDLRHIIVTHVHLDHAGGVGQMMEVSPKALLHCHPRALPHIIDPSRLIAGAQAVYGDQAEDIFGPVKPVAKERVVAQGDETMLDAKGHELVFYDTPGHAKHHLCVIDQSTGSLFSGDTVGIRYTRAYTGWPFEWGFPTTTPSDFNPDVLLETLDRLLSRRPRRVCHTHYGVTEPARAAFDFTRRGLQRIQAMMTRLSETSTQSEVQSLLTSTVRQELDAIGHPEVDVGAVALDIFLNSQGILVYLQKRAVGKL